MLFSKVNCLEEMLYPKQHLGYTVSSSAHNYQELHPHCLHPVFALQIRSTQLSFPNIHLILSVLSVTLLDPKNLHAPYAKEIFMLKIFILKMWLDHCIVYLGCNIFLFLLKMWLIHYIHWLYKVQRFFSRLLHLLFIMFLSPNDIWSKFSFFQWHIVDSETAQTDTVCVRHITYITKHNIKPNNNKTTTNIHTYIRYYE